MHYLSYFLIVVANIPMLSASDCLSDGKKIIDGKVYTKKLEPDEQVFGFYTCRSCGKRSISKPDPREVKVNCAGCGVAHTTEAVDAPAYFRRTDGLNNTDVYIVDWEPLVQAGSIEERAARSGRKVQCPFCAGSTFSINHSCPNCGASVVDAPKINPEERKVTLSFHQKKQDQNNNSAPSLVKKDLLTKKRMIYAGTGSLLGAAAVIYWGGNYNYQTTGRVVLVDEFKQQAVVAYTDYYGAAQQVLLDYDPHKSSPWYLTEEVTLYFVRWPAHQGAERLNGEVYPFIPPQEK